MRKIVIFLSFVIMFSVSACSFAAETASVCVSVNQQHVMTYSENNLFGLMDENKNIITKPEYKKLIRLGNSSWIAQKKNRFGILDNSGNFLIKPKYRHAERLYGDYVKLGNDNDYGLYDENGNIVIEPKYSKIDPLYGKMFLTYKNYRYGVTDSKGKVLLDNIYDDIYMPAPDVMRIQAHGDWYQIEELKPGEIELPENAFKVTVNNKDIKVTRMIADTGLISSYSALTAADYFLKIFSSISPAYEQTIDELMFSQGAETVNIFMELGWIPKFPFTYAKKYYTNIRTPFNGPLSDIRNDLRKQMRD